MADALAYKLRVEWFDDRACLTKDFVLTYFVNPGSFKNEVSLFDIKCKRMFLKRAPCDTVQEKDLYLGSRITIYSRQLKIVGFCDQFTRERLGGGMKLFFCSIPASSYKDLGLIFSTLYQNGFNLTKAKSLLEPQSNRFSVCLEIVGSVNFNIQQNSLWDQVFMGASNPSIRNVLVSETNTETDSIFEEPSSTAVYDNCSLLLIKPHAIRGGRAGEIISFILDAGFEVSALQLFTLLRSEAENFTEVYKGVLNPREYADMNNELSSGPCIAIEVRAENCVNVLRRHCGPHDVEIAKALRPNSIRGKFGNNRMENAVHCTDLEEDGVLESQYFFDILVNTKASV